MQIQRAIDKALLLPRPALLMPPSQDGGQLINLRSGFAADPFQFRLVQKAFHLKVFRRVPWAFL
jgi:hypothetical protein